MRHFVILVISAFVLVSACTVPSEEVDKYMNTFELANGTAALRNPADYLRDNHPAYSFLHRKDIEALDCEYIGMLRQYAGLSDNADTYAPRFEQKLCLLLPEYYSAIITRRVAVGRRPLFHAVYGPYNLQYSEGGHPVVFSNRSLCDAAGISLSELRHVRYTVLAEKTLKDDETDMVETVLFLFDDDFGLVGSVAI